VDQSKGILSFKYFYALPTLYLCFVFIREQRATFSTYTVKGMVFIAEVKNVYSVERTGSLNKAVCTSFVKVKRRIQ
jgi:hypothetical protein